MPPRRPSAEAVEISPWRGLVRVQGAVRRELDRALRVAEGLSVWDYTVIRVLAESDGRCMRMSDLAAATDYTPSGLTRLVGRLETSGTVERTPCPDDGRGLVATLTPTGLRVFQRARRTHLKTVREHFLAHLTDADRAVLGELWERLLPGATK